MCVNDQFVSQPLCPATPLNTNNKTNINKYVYLAVIV